MTNIYKGVRIMQTTALTIFCQVIMPVILILTSTQNHAASAYDARLSWDRPTHYENGDAISPDLEIIYEVCISFEENAGTCASIEVVGAAAKKEAPLLFEGIVPQDSSFVYFRVRARDVTTGLWSAYSRQVSKRVRIINPPDDVEVQ